MKGKTDLVKTVKCDITLTMDEGEMTELVSLEPQLQSAGLIPASMRTLLDTLKQGLQDVSKDRTGKTV